MEYLFLDESGNLNKNGTDYFVIAIFKANSNKNRKKIKNIISHVRKRKFKKELKNKKEVKFYNASESLRKHILKKISERNIEIFYIILKKTLPQNRKWILKENPNIIYMELVLKLLLHMNIKRLSELRVDMFLSIEYRKKFNKIVKDKIPYIKEIYHSHSEKWKGIQISDILAGSYFQLIERKNDEYIKILDNNYKVIEYKKLEL